MYSVTPLYTGGKSIFFMVIALATSRPWSKCPKTPKDGPKRSHNLFLLGLFFPRSHIVIFWLFFVIFHPFLVIWEVKIAKKSPYRPPNQNSPSKSRLYDVPGPSLGILGHFDQGLAVAIATTIKNIDLPPVLVIHAHWRTNWLVLFEF